MHFSIRNERRDGLCATCSHVQIVEGDREHIVHCNELSGYGQNGRITFPVRSCTDYIEKGKQTEYEMQKIAWVIEVDKKDRSFVGFRPPVVRKEDE